jgi:hypothetical protein
MYSCCYCCVFAVITLSLSSSKNTVLVCYCRPSSHRTQYSTNTLTTYRLYVSIISPYLLNPHQPHPQQRKNTKE